MMVATETKDVFEILNKASMPLHAFVLDRLPENPHPFEAVIKSCNEKYGVEETLASLEKILYATDSETRDDVANALCYAYEDEQSLWMEMMIKFLISDAADFYNYTFLANHISGFDVDTREFYQELYDRLPRNSRKCMYTAGEIICLDAYKQLNTKSSANVLVMANYEGWDYKKVSYLLTLDRYIDLTKEQMRECFEFAKNHPLSTKLIITTCNKILNGDLK